MVVFVVTMPIDSKKTVPEKGGMPKQLIFSQVKVAPLNNCKHLSPLGKVTYKIKPSSAEVTGIEFRWAKVTLGGIKPP